MDTERDPGFKETLVMDQGVTLQQDQRQLLDSSNCRKLCGIITHAFSPGTLEYSGISSVSTYAASQEKTQESVDRLPTACLSKRNDGLDGVSATCHLGSGFQDQYLHLTGSLTCYYCMMERHPKSALTVVGFPGIWLPKGRKPAVR